MSPPPFSSVGPAPAGPNDEHPLPRINVKCDFFEQPFKKKIKGINASVGLHRGARPPARDLPLRKRLAERGGFCEHDCKSGDLACIDSPIGWLNASALRKIYSKLVDELVFTLSNRLVERAGVVGHLCKRGTCAYIPRRNRLVERLVIPL